MTCRPQSAGLYCPIPATPHSSFTDLDRQAFAWIRDYDLVSGSWLDEMEQAGPLRLLAAACPDGIPERMQLVAEFWLWAYALDDTFFDGGIFTGDPSGACQALRPLLRALEFPGESLVQDDAWTAALRSLRRQLETIGTPMQIHRWAAAAREMLFSLVCETAYIHRETLPGLRDYLTLRMETSGAKHHLLLIDFTHGYELTYEQLTAPPVRAVSEACCVLLGIDNDLFSYARESATEGTLRLNAVDVLTRDRDLSIPQAFAEVIRIRNQIMSGFLHLSVDIIAEADAGIAHYTHNLGQWVRANLDWSARTQRYAAFTATGSSALPHLEICDSPTVTTGSHQWWECLD
ncbi:hypothetical protein F3087_26795 [Nocardia colli]|uniref:Terpene synthase n=1 Tax=Nocardia colli TaxID=2545717 RepID=A0A5N0EBN3_9NOCA|nr:hypothetical protein [Nocardia colli]KAA8886200.1 hypothetical protein F3087_26795 [Nocardia colli]